MLRWIEPPSRFALGDTEFLTLGDNGPDDASMARLFWVGTLKSTADNFVLLKPTSLVERYVELVDTLRPTRVFELGIFEGGSMAFLAALARPAKLVGIEFVPERVAALDEFVSRQGLGDVVRAHYGVDQADKATLRAIIEQEFGNEPLDMVVDDASHELAPTRSSFNTLFPLLRPGGIFVIEDWPWGIVPTDSPVLREYIQGLPTPLANLVFELLLACATTQGLIERVSVYEDLAVVVRGPKAVDPNTFDISTCYWDALRGELTLGDAGGTHSG